MKDCTLDWVFETHSRHLTHSHSGKSSCDFSITFDYPNVFVPAGHVFDTLPNNQQFPGFQFDQHPLCHAMSCPPQNGDSEEHLSLPASRWGSRPARVVTLQVETQNVGGHGRPKR